MNKQDDISATEKLLDIIRKDEATAGLDDLALELATPPAGEGPPATVVAEVPTPVPKTHAANDDQLRFFEKMPRPRPVKNHTVRTTMTLGVDIRPTALTLAKVAVTGDRPRVLDFRHLPLAGETFPSDPRGFEAFLANAEFRKTLQKELASFCTEPKQCNIWCALPREFIEIHHLTIPPVPVSEVANAIFWATKKHTTFDEKNTILDFTLLNGENNTVAKRTAIVFLAPRQTVFALKDLFAGIGRSLTGITTSSIGFQNQIKRQWLTPPAAFALLHIQEQSSFIDLYHNGVWIFGRDIKTGLKSFIDSIIEQAESRGARIDERTAKRILFGGEMEVPAALEPAGDDILALDEEKAIAGDLKLPAAERLVRQLERTFDYCVTTFGTPRATKIYISGQPAASRLLLASISAESGLDCAPADPFSASKKMLRCTIPPTDPKQRCAMNAAFGLACAQPLETQNFLNTYQKRRDSIRSIKTNKVIWAGFAVIIVLLGGFGLFHHRIVTRAETQLVALEKQLATATTTFNGKIDSTRLLQTAQKIQGGRAARKMLAQKYYQIGLIGEITRLLPDRVKLVRLAIEPVPADPRQIAARKSKGAQKYNRQAVLEGVVSGDEQSREFVMSSLLQQLAGSPLVRDVSFIQQQSATVGGKTVLYFSAVLTPEPMVIPSAVKLQARKKP